MDMTFQTLKTAFAAAISWWLAYTVLHGPYPYFAPLAAILSVQITVSESIKKASQRLIGTIGGVIISSYIGSWLSTGAVSVFIAVAFGMAIGSLLQLPQYIASQAAVSSLMVLAFSQSTGYAFGRVLETIIGSVIGVAVNAFIAPPNAIPKAEKQIHRLSEKAAATLISLGLGLRQDSDKGLPSIDATRLREQTVKGIHSIQHAEESLRFNPLMTGKRRRLAQLVSGMRHLDHISTQIRGIHRGFIDLAGKLPADIELNDLLAAIDLTAACVKEYGENIIMPSNHTASKLLDRIEQAQSAQDACLAALLMLDSLVLTREIGAILTDLHRILAETAPEPADSLRTKSR